MNEVELEVALERMARNRAARWPNRGAHNRLEPECWPEVKPRFRIDPNSSVFAIGSCFSRVVEWHFDALGFDVPVRRFLDANDALLGQNGEEIILRFTPASVFQELEWTKRIRDRDGIVTLDDIRPFLLDIGGDRFIDLQRRFQQNGDSREAILAQRQLLYRLFEKVFDCDTVVITLGYIECWYDRKVGQYVEFGDYLRKHNDGNRFLFKRLSFQEAYEYTKKAIELISANGKTNIVLITSPAPIAATFTDEDVVVANDYEKSVLRAVAGQIAEDYPNVDYFPAYENVMLTKQSYVWANDLRHIEPEFVGRLVGRLCKTYSDDSELTKRAEVHEEQSRFANLVKHSFFEEARQLLAKSNASSFDIGDVLYLRALVQLHLHFGENDLARTHAGALRDLAPNLVRQAGSTLMICARAFESVGDIPEAERTWTMAFEYLRNPTQIKVLIQSTMLNGELETTRRLLTHIEQQFIDDPDLLDYCAMTRLTLGDADDAERVFRLALAGKRRTPELLMHFGNLLVRKKRFDEASEVLIKARELDPRNARVLRTLVPLHMARKRLDEAEHDARTLISLAPLDPLGHSYLASALKLTGRPFEALVPAKRAAELDPGNEKFRRYLDELRASMPAEVKGTALT